MRVTLRSLICALCLLPAFQARAADPQPGPMQSNSSPTATTAPGDAPAAKTDASAAKSDAPAFDVNKLFANTCGWCHLNGGRAPGKGPQLMGTTLTDGEMIHRIKTGKVGQMPAFGTAFDDAQIKAIIGYIRDLKAEN